MATQLNQKEKASKVQDIRGGEYTPSDGEPTDKDGDTTQVIYVEKVEPEESRWKKIKDFLFWFLLIDAFFK
ncbi:MAG: hypothetical protein V7742_21195 [Halioglobus sp.]